MTIVLIVVQTLCVKFFFLQERGDLLAMENRFFLTERTIWVWYSVCKKQMFCVSEPYDSGSFGLGLSEAVLV